MYAIPALNQKALQVWATVATVPVVAVKSAQLLVELAEADGSEMMFRRMKLEVGELVSLVRKLDQQYEALWVCDEITDSKIEMSVAHEFTDGSFLRVVLGISATTPGDMEKFWATLEGVAA